MSAAVQIPARLYSQLRKLAKCPPRYVEDCHPKQRAFIEDRSKFKAALAGRRGGKTGGDARWLLEGAESRPGTKSLFIALTRGKAKSLVWDDGLLPIELKYRIGLKLSHDEGMLYVKHPNGSRIWLLGIDDRSQVEKVRGEKLFRVVVDEAQAYPDDVLKELIEGAITPALMDLDGELAVTGTPSPLLGGYFWAITTGGDPEVPKWPTHQFNALDNPFLASQGGKSGAEQHDEVKRRNGWNDETPRFIREYLGLWHEDRGSLVYPFTAANNWQPDTELPFGLPPGEYTYGLGVDLGFSEHSTAFVLAAARRGTGQIYILSAYTRSRLIPTALAAHVDGVRHMVREKTKTIGFPGNSLRVIVDEGALGRGYAEQMRVMGVPCEPAEKKEKRAYQEWVRGLVMLGKVPERNAAGEYEGGAGMVVNVRECRELLAEANKLQFDEETGLEDQRYTRHCADAMLYVTRALHPIYKPEENEPKYGSAAALDLEMKRERERMIREQEKKRRGAYG